MRYIIVIRYPFLPSDVNSFKRYLLGNVQADVKIGNNVLMIETDSMLNEDEIVSRLVEHVRKVIIGKLKIQVRKMKVVRVDVLSGSRVVYNVSCRLKYKKKMEDLASIVISDSILMTCQGYSTVRYITVQAQPKLFELMGKS